MKTTPIFLLLLLLILITDCTSKPKAEYDLKTLNHVSFDEVFELKKTINLPNRIPGHITHFDRNATGDLILAEESTLLVWLYKSEDNSWNKLIIDDCHPGIYNHPIGITFSNSHIFVSNSYNWTGYRFNLDGSCGGIFIEEFIPPGYITGLNDGFIAFNNDIGDYKPLITKFDSTGTTIYKKENISDPNPYFTNRVRISRGFASVNDSILIIANVSSPELHYFNHISGEFIGKKPIPVPSVFKSVNEMFDVKRYKEIGFFYLTQLDPHMFISQISLASDSAVLFHVPYMLTEEDDLIILQDINNGNYVYTGLSKKEYKSYFLNKNALFVFDYDGENTIMRKYNVNPDVLKNLQNSADPI